LISFSQNFARYSKKFKAKGLSLLYAYSLHHLNCVQ
jgi:hypothetical protein